MEIAMQLHRELIKSDFVRLMMFSEISKFLFVLTDNNCYWLVHNWISKEGLLLISNEPFLFFVSDNEEANHMKSYLHLGKPMPTNEAQRTKNIAWGEMELFVRETGSGSRDKTRHARSYIWLYDCLRGYSIVVTARKQVLTHSVVNFVGSRNFYPLDDFLSIGTLWS